MQAFSGRQHNSASQLGAIPPLGRLPLARLPLARLPLASSLVVKAVLTCWLLGSGTGVLGQTGDGLPPNQTAADQTTASQNAEGQTTEDGSADADATAAWQALQAKVLRTVADTERSVVAISRVRVEPRGDEPARTPFPRPFNGQVVPPTDADFVPSEFSSGVAVAARQVLTTYHSIGAPLDSKYFVWNQKRPYEATVLAADPWFDLAILEIADGELAPIRFGDASKVGKGQFVVVLGNPEALARDGEPSAAWGMVSNRLRRAPRVPERSTDALGRETIHQYGTLLQIQSELARGYQGGAVLNLNGEMIGLLTALTAGGEHTDAAGLAVPVTDDFRRVVQLLQQGQRPDYGFLGVAPEPLAAGLRRRGLHGAVVGRVLSGTPAALAGVRNGDLISHVANQPVFDDDDLIRVVGSMAPATSTQLRVLRGDRNGRQRTLELDVVLAKKHVTGLRPSVGEPLSPQWRGLRVDYSTAVSEFESYALRIGRFRGVVAESVDEDSAAWQAGLRGGAFISHVNGRTVSSPAEFERLVRPLTGGVEVQVVDLMGRTEQRTVSP